MRYSLKGSLKMIITKCDGITYDLLKYKNDFAFIAIRPDDFTHHAGALMVRPSSALGPWCSSAKAEENLKEIKLDLPSIYAHDG